MFLNSKLAKQILAILRKEWLSESRSMSGFLTMGQISFVCLIIVNNITWFNAPKPLTAAGLFWMILVFAGSLSVTRTFLQEEENRTADFWRLYANSNAVFWGKAIFNCIQLIAVTLILMPAFVIMLRLYVPFPGTFALCGILGAMCIAITLTCSAALAAPSRNRFAVCAAISVPLLLFLVNLGVTGTAFSMGEGLPGAERAPIVLALYFLSASVIGPGVYSKIWKG